MQIETCGRYFRAECNSPEGHELRRLIERNSNAMVAASDAGVAALRPVIEEVPLRLVRAMHRRPSLMRAFCHMGKLEMEERGFVARGKTKAIHWDEVRLKSEMLTYRRKRM
jgi:hypothetical protein